MSLLAFLWLIGCIAACVIAACVSDDVWAAVAERIRNPRPSTLEELHRHWEVQDRNRRLECTADEIVVGAILDIADELADGHYTPAEGAQNLRLLVHEIDPRYCEKGHVPGDCVCEVADPADSHDG